MIIITFCCCFSLFDHFVNTFKVISFLMLGLKMAPTPIVKFLFPRLKFLGYMITFVTSHLKGFNIKLVL